MFFPGGNHYSLEIDGALTPPNLTARAHSDEFTRRQLRGVVAGEITIEPAGARQARRIWPNEPNVGFFESEMALLLDGRLRIGGPTLKTYELNKLPSTSRVRESLVQMNDTYRKLQASEDQLEQADMLNAVGAWKSEDTAAVGTNLDVGSVTLKGDARTYASTAAALSILRRGTYLLSYRVHCTPNAGSLTLTLTVGSQTFDWLGAGLSTTLTVADCVPYEKADDSADAVTLTNTLGTNIGAAGALATYFQIVKLR